MRNARATICCCLLLLSPVSERRMAFSQESCRGDIIRGRVVASDGNAVVGAQVFVTELSTRSTQSRLTDASAMFSVCHEQRTGAYVVVVSSPPNPTWRKRVTVDPHGALDLAVTLAPPPVLQPVTVVAPRRNRVRRGEEVPELATAGQSVGGQPTPDQEESIGSYAASLPGVLQTGQMSERQFSVLGLSPDQNRVTLNGLTYVGTFPRIAGPVGTFGMRLGTAAADASAGGFSGASLALTSRPGLNVTRRSVRTTLDGVGSRNDRVAWKAGRTPFTVRASGSLEGTLPRRMLHATTVDVTARDGPRTSLQNIDGLPLASTGLVPDDAHRFVTAAESLGLPATLVGHSDRQSSIRAAFISRVDVNPSSPTPFDVTLSTTAERTNGVGLSPLRLPTQASSATQSDLTLQVARANSWGPVLHEPRFGVSLASSASDLDWQAPRALVRTNSNLEEAGVLTLGAGGGALRAPSGHLTGFQFRDQASWYSKTNRHRFHVTGEAERLRFSSGAPLDFGSYYYTSLEAFSLQKAASYSRQVSSASRDVAQTAGAISASDIWRLNQRVQLQLGTRVDGTQLGFAQVDPASWQARNEHRADVSFSPRIGAFVTYGRSERKGLSSGSLRFGAGHYVNRWSPDRLARDAPARQREAVLTCLDDAVPTPAWPGWSIQNLTGSAARGACARWQ